MRKAHYSQVIPTFKAHPHLVKASFFSAGMRREVIGTEQNEIELSPSSDGIEDCMSVWSQPNRHRFSRTQVIHASVSESQELLI